MKPEKTWKREAAVALVAWLIGWTHWLGRDGFDEAEVSILTAFITAIFAFAGGAFAADWAGKQSRWAYRVPETLDDDGDDKPSDGKAG